MYKKIAGGFFVEKKEDRRTAMSKRMLKDALTGILKEKDIYHISIRELCERADVNRTTFYKYYGSQFDLLTDMESDLLVFLAGVIRDHDEDTIKAIETACMYLEDNLEFARLIFNNNVDPDFPQKVFSMEAVKKAVIKKCGGRHDKNELDYLYNYMTYGAYRVVCVWLNKEKREPPREIAVILAKTLLS